MIDTREQYGDVFAVYWPIAVGVFVAIVVVMTVLAVRFRARGGEHEHGAFSKKQSKHTPLEAGWVVLLSATVAFLVYLTFSTLDDTAADAPADIGGDARSADTVPRAAAEIDVTSARWIWRFDYPGSGVTVTGSPGRPPTLVVPVGNVRFDLTTIDVIHAFFIPHLRFKRDAFPGRITRFTLGFDTPGDVPGSGACAQYCGWQHKAMDFRVRVLPPAEFRRWLSARRGRGAGT